MVRIEIYRCKNVLDGAVNIDSSSDDEVSETEAKPSSGLAQVHTIRQFRTFIDIPPDVFYEVNHFQS